MPELSEIRCFARDINEELTGSTNSYICPACQPLESAKHSRHAAGPGRDRYETK